MARNLKLKAGCKVERPEMLFEGFEVTGNQINANVSVDKIESVMQHFIVMHDEPLFFILEIPTLLSDETEIGDGVIKTRHRDVYYIDGCTQEAALTIMFRVGELLFNDGLSAFGYGCHNSGDEIMFGKYNVLTVFSRNTDGYADFFEPHDIDRTEKLVTAWDTFSQDHPGVSEIYEADGKTVFDIPGQFKEWGIYFAERREDE
ncbi:MAG: hypothetical protein IJL71_00705 [Oscillospiraceae bacterium]|nr:hypothetical protein [Oscillospiraceae bacterium]